MKGRIVPHVETSVVWDAVAWGLECCTIDQEDHGSSPPSAV